MATHQHLNNINRQKFFDTCTARLIKWFPTSSTDIATPQPPRPIIFVTALPYRFEYVLSGIGFCFNVNVENMFEIEKEVICGMWYF